MKICFIADARSPIARNWISYFPLHGHDVHVLSTEETSTNMVIPGAVLHYTGLGKGLGNRGSRVADSQLSTLKRLVDPHTRWGRGLFRIHRNLVLPIKCLLITQRARCFIRDLQPDVVHALRIPIEAELGACVGIHPFVASVWGNDFTLHAANSFAHRALTRHTMHTVDGLMADCYADLCTARRFGLSKDVPTLRIPGCGGLTRNLFSPGAANRDLLTRLGIDPDRPVVLNARGFRTYVRNDTFFSSIPKVLAARPDIQFVAVGLLGWRRAERWIEQTGISSSVIMTGHLPQAELAELYRSATIVVSAAEHDGTPNTLLEAMASECLPICGDLPSIREWITNDVNGILIDPADPDMMSSAILAGLSDKSLRERAARINVQLVAQYANYDECMRGAELFYREVIKHTRVAVGSAGKASFRSLLEVRPPRQLEPAEIREFQPSAAPSRTFGEVRRTLGSAAYFTSIASDWSENYAEGGKMSPRIYRCLNPLREKLSVGSKVLDFGCGSGDITLALGRAGYDVTGLDSSSAMIDAARLTCKGASIDLIEVAPGPWSEIPVEAGAFDAILASSVIEYVQEPAAQIKELVLVLRDDGIIVMTVPNASHLVRMMERPLRFIARSPLVMMALPHLPKVLKAYVGYLALSVNHFPLSEWLNIFSASGLEIDNISTTDSPLLTVVARKVSTVSEVKGEADATSFADADRR